MTVVNACRVETNANRRVFTHAVSARAATAASLENPTGHLSRPLLPNAFTLPSTAVRRSLSAVCLARVTVRARAAIYVYFIASQLSKKPSKTRLSGQNVVEKKCTYYTIKVKKSPLEPEYKKIKFFLNLNQITIQLYFGGD